MGKASKEIRCLARNHRRQSPPCGEPSDTVRKFQAAPGLWVHVPLCHAHQHVWDEAGDFQGREVFRELPCNRETKI